MLPTTLLDGGNMKMISRRERLSIAIAEEAVRQHLKLDKPLVASEINLRLPSHGGNLYMVVELKTPQMRGGVRPMKFVVIVDHSLVHEHRLQVVVMRDDVSNYPVAGFCWSYESPGIELES